MAEAAVARSAPEISELGISIIDAMEDSALLGSHFQPPATWHAWKVFLAAISGLGVIDPVVFERQTQRKTAPKDCNEAWVVCGRRGGKSRIIALVATVIACLRDYRGMFAPGETGTLMVIGSDRRQARVIFRYIEAMITTTPVLKRMLAGPPTKERIELKSGIAIEVHTANFRAVRGYTLIGVIMDEIAFWRDEASANPDVEIVNAIRPGMATVPGAMLIGLSSPYARRGVMWQAYESHFGKEHPNVLVWQAATKDMNPTVPDSLIERAYDEDPSAAAAEYGGQFRRDIEAFVQREVIDAICPPQRFQLEPVPGIAYAGFTDPSGGTADSFCTGVAHRVKERYVLDAIFETDPPFSPMEATAQHAKFLLRYNVKTVRGDRYAGEWPREQFAKNGVAYVTSDMFKSDIYRESLPLLNSKQAELLDVRRLRNQLCALERRVSNGKEVVDHPPGGHDDVANVALGAIISLKMQRETRCTW